MVPLVESRAGMLPILLVALILGCTSSPAPTTRPAIQTSDATLENTYWKLLALGGQRAIVADNIPEPHLLLHPADRRASGSTGCNRFSGSYELVSDSLSVRPLASTLVACADPALNRQETAFLAAVGETRRWRVTGDTLLLGDEAQPVARFVAVYLR